MNKIMRMSERLYYTKFLTHSTPKTMQNRIFYNEYICDVSCMYLCLLLGGGGLLVKLEHDDTIRENDTNHL